MTSAAGVVVEPSAFAIVSFDAETIARLAAEVAARVGLAGEPIVVRVDEHSMLSRARLASADPVVIEAHSGAFEDRSRPRHLSPANVTDELACLLQRAVDRRQAGYAGAPDEDALTAQQAAAWDVHCWGRTARWQAVTFQPRHRYDFLLTCGFSAMAQDAFTRLWEATSLGWAGVLALTPPPPARP